MKTGSESEATEFLTDANGDATIYNLLTYPTNIYEIIEVTERDKKKYDSQDPDFITWTSNLGSGTGKDSIKVRVDRQKSFDTETQSSSYVEVKIENKQKYVDIAGLVWDEGLVGKNSDVDYKYKGEPDHLVNEVTVRLVDSTTKQPAKNRWDYDMEQRSGGSYKTIRFQNEQDVEVTVTNEPGHFRFEKLEIDKLKDYYVEFIYNGMCYQSVPVETFLSNKETEEIVSRAAEDGTLSGEQRDTFNNKYQTITHNASNQEKIEYDYNQEEHQSHIKYGENPVYGWTCNEHGDSDNGYKAWYPINDVYDQYIITANTYNLYNGGINKIKSEDEIRQEDLEVVDNINLGIYEREQPDLAIAKDLKSVRLSINGHSHVYEYASRFDNQELTNQMLGDNDKDRNNNRNGFYVGVKYQNNAPWATEKYTRAIYRSDYEWNDGNEDDKLKVYFIYQIKIKNTSSTLDATVNQIVDYYDGRYKENLECGTRYDDGKLTDSTDSIVNVSKGSPYNKAEIDTRGIFNNIIAGETRDLYIQLELTRDRVKDILKNVKVDANGNIISQTGPEADLNNITEITSYSTFKDGKVYGGIDEDSNPGTLPEVQNVEDESVYEDDTDIAPPVRLELAVRRRLKGIVFEDETKLVDFDGHKTREGDGIYTPGEQTISGVSVTLYKISDSNELEPAEVWDDSANGGNGAFTDSTKTTEGDGIFEISGFIPDNYIVEYVWGDDDIHQRSVQRYKATIYDDSNYNNKYWYENENPRYSDAHDDWETRQNIDKQIEDIYNGYEENATLNRMKSDTAKFTIEVEDPEYQQQTKYKIDESNGQSIIHELNNIDFGIAQRPKQSISIDKNIDTIELALLDGEERISVKRDPATNLFKGIDGLMNVQPGAITKSPKGMVWVELDNELVQGSTLEINYDLSVKNTSEADYKNEAFYTKGTKSGDNSNIIWLSAESINDYMDGDWGHKTGSDGWNEILLTQLGSDSSTDMHYRVSEEVLNSDTIKDKIILNSSVNKQLEPDSSPEISQVKAIKVLTSGVDISLDNEAEIICVNKNGGALLETVDDGIENLGNYVTRSSDNIAEATEADDTMAQNFTLTPNTGANLDFIVPTMIGIVVLASIGVGSLIIRKIVQGNE